MRSSARDLYEQGLQVYTTLDLDMQPAAERALENQLRAIESGADGKFEHPTYEQYDAQGDDRSDRDAEHRRRICRARSSPWTPRPARSARWSAAATSTTASSTARRRRSGSPDPPSSRSSTRRRSERLPAVVRHGRRLAQRRAAMPGEPPWTPQNYDGKFEGPMTCAAALYQSRNIIAIKLGMELGRADRDRRWRASSASPRRSRPIRRSTSARPTSIRSR